VRSRRCVARWLPERAVSHSPRGQRLADGVRRLILRTSDPGRIRIGLLTSRPCQSCLLNVDLIRERIRMDRYLRYSQWVVVSGPVRLPRCRRSSTVTLHTARNQIPAVGPRILENRPCRHRYLIPATRALSQCRSQQPSFGVIAARTPKPFRPAQAEQILPAGLLGAELRFEHRKSPGILRRRLFHGRHTTHLVTGVKWIPISIG